MSYVAFAAVFWLLIFSVISYKLVHSDPGNSCAKQVEGQSGTTGPLTNEVLVLIILAWLTILSPPLGEWLKTQIFG